MPDAAPFRTARIDDLERIPLEYGSWRPVRRPLGVTGFAVNAYSADAAGEHVIEPHDELDTGSGGHEELYLVLAGAARFTVDGTDVEAPAGTLVLVAPDARREAVATAPGTTVLVVGGKPGAGLPVSPFEHWYAADPAYRAGDYARAIEIVSAGLADYPDHGTLHYQLACYTALAGDADAAVEHLRRAFAADPRTREWAADDADLETLRGRPDFPV